MDPHIGPRTKVIPLKLFLDIVPSSTEDGTRAMRGQPNRLSREGYFICFGFVSYHRCFCAGSTAFLCGRAFVFVSARLVVHYFVAYLVLGSFIKQTSTAMPSSTMAV